MHSRGMAPFDWQREAWQAHLEGKSGLIIAATGTGKTEAAWLGTLARAIAEPIPTDAWTRSSRKAASPPLQAVWITPLRALAQDTTQALLECIQGLELPWSIELRTGDSSSATKARQRTALPTALVITPESLSLLLSYPESRQLFRHLRSIIVDEWHELLGTKRGVQTELAMARLSALAPAAQRWALSATLGDPAAALAALLGNIPVSASCIVHGQVPKALEISTLTPPTIDRFPWAGHLGLKLLPAVVARIEQATTSLLFTNTRNQTELWYQALLQARPDWAGRIAIHHGSLDSRLRSWVEQSVQSGQLLAVVCTSSLDLGVDFAPVDQIIQIGSPKGVSRLLQRAGRSGHRPGAVSRVVFVATHALEFLELAAAQQAIAAQTLEVRLPLKNCLDCLAQHAVTLSLADGYQRQEFIDEVRSTHAFGELTDSEFDWILDFVTTGGCLHAYPDFQRVIVENQRYHVKDPRIARRHRMAIGTITGDLMMKVRYLSGGNIGTVEESFAARLQEGDRFLLGGRLLQVVFLRDGVLWVRKAKGQATAVPRWMGGRMPLSTQLASGVRQLLHAVRQGQPLPDRLQMLSDLLELQERWSLIPGHGELLVETYRARDGHSIMIYPFEGRNVSEGLAALLAYRFSLRQQISFSIAVNDYGFLLHSRDSIDLNPVDLRELLAAENLSVDILASLNATEMAKRRFRDIARIAGLVHQGLPGQTKNMRHLQASSSMVFEALREYDPGNLLLAQSRREVLEDQLEQHRLESALQRIAASQIVVRRLPYPSPFAFPLIVERMRERLSSETLADRVQKMQQRFEKAAAMDGQAEHDGS
jgi:ATP-dependent Lhr-like helicase